MTAPYGVETYTLVDGTTVPWLAWGHGNGFGEQILKAGVRHIDTAQGYKTEGDTGEVLAKTDLSREQIFVTTKVSAIEDEAPMLFSQLVSSIEESIKKLGTTPDLILIHNPFVAENHSELKKFWQTLEDLKDQGKLKAIGVSNFRPQDLELILDGAKHVPVVNQLEFHPFVLAHLEPVLAIQKKYGIVTEAYGPLKPLQSHPTKGGPLKPVLERIAARLASSPDTAELVKSDPNNAVLLLWLHERGVIAVTGTQNVDRAAGLGTFAKAKTGTLTKEEIDEIERIGKTIHWRHYKEHMSQDFPPPDLPDGSSE